MRQTLRVAVIVPVIVTMVLTFMPIMPNINGEVHAADTRIATMNGESYWNFKSLASDLDDMGGKSVTIEMLRDWDRQNDENVKERLQVPSDCNLTLNMNGHMYNRRLTQSDDYEMNGELFVLRQNAKMTINGGAGDTTSHEVYVHSSTSRDKYAEKKYQTTGGTLSGGSSTNGAGCFHMLSNSSVTLNDVTVAGCRAEQRGGSDGYGGAVYFQETAAGEGSCTFKMNNSIIYGCYAYNDGGAIYSNSPRNFIFLNRSKIENNYCYGNGGGIAYRYAYCSLVGTGANTKKGDTRSSICDNKAAGCGGGIWVERSGLSISNLIISGNDGTGEHGKKGKGGGLYVDTEGTTITSCDITGNQCRNGGAGVYLTSNITDFTLSGSTVINNNNGHNLYISDSDPLDTRLTLKLTTGADVKVHYYDTKNKDSIMVTPGTVNDKTKSKDCTRYLKAGNSGYYFSFEPAPNQRKIYYKKGTAPDIPEPQGVGAHNANNASGKESTASVIAGKVGTVGPGGYSGNDYDLIRGFYLHEKTDSGTDDKTGIFYYTDAYFDDGVDAKKYNEHLATTSWALAFAGTYLRKFDIPDSQGNTYYNKHAGARQFLADIGCPDQSIYVNDSMVSKPGTDTVGCTIGSKELAKADGTKTGKILIPVTVRGGGYESEWASNCTLGAGTPDEGRNGEAKGFSTAADQVVDAIDQYINKYELEDEIHDGKVVFWVSGFSRAGATANITSKRLVEMYADGSSKAGKNNRVFGYTCEAAKGGTDLAQTLGAENSAYHCIHNMINRADVVPLVAPWQMGFKRYGVDHYIPGAPAKASPEMSYIAVKKHTGSSSITGVTTYADNQTQEDLRKYLTKSSQYDDLRDGKSSKYNIKLQQHLSSIDSDMVFDDYFHPMAMDFVPQDLYENGVYDENRVEDFLEDFFRAAQEGLPEEGKDWSIAMGSRKVWAEDKTTINGVTYPAVQDCMRDTMALVFSMDDETSQTFMALAGNITNRIQVMVTGDVTMLELYRNVIGSWHKRDDEDKDKYIQFVWKKLKESGALEELDPSDAEKLKNNWPTLANFIFRLVDNDYNYKPGDHPDQSGGWAGGMTKSMTYIPTFATFSSSILSNHYPEINIAWTRLSDDYYMNEGQRLDLTEYRIDQPPKVNAPGAYAGGEELVPDDETANRLVGDQRIKLENTEIVGEAIYYDLVDITAGGSTGRTIERDQIYRGGIDLSMGSEGDRQYKLTAFSMSYGKRSDKAVYYIDLYDDKHDVSVLDEIDVGNQSGKTRSRDFIYKEGDEVRFSAGEPSAKVFDSWAVKDEKGDDVTDKIFAGEYEGGEKNVNAVFKMPEAGKDGFGVEYALTFTADYKNKIGTITTDVDAPVQGGDTLDSEGDVTFDTTGEKQFTYPVTWSYIDQGKIVPASGTAYDDTTYIATINIPKDEDAGIAFLDDLQAVYGGDPSVIPLGGCTAKKNDADGSATIDIVFNPTGNGGHPRPSAYLYFNVKPWDLNLKEYVPGEGTWHYSAHPSTDEKESIATLRAPDVQDEIFVKWDFSKQQGAADQQIRPVSDDPQVLYDKTIEVLVPRGFPAGVEEQIIDAQYIPVINEVTAAVDQPVGGEPIQTAPRAAASGKPATLKVTISSEYEINPDFVSIAWTPEPIDKGGTKIADYLVSYTATISIVPQEDERTGEKYIEVKLPEDTEYTKISATFLFSDKLTATVNGEQAACDRGSNSISYTFPATGYQLAADAESPADVSGIKRGEDLGKYIPKTIKVLRNDGMKTDAQVEWGEPAKVDPSADPRSEIQWEVSGTVILPDNMTNPKGYSLDVSMKLTVNEAQHAVSPEASLDPGEYLTDQVTTLSTETKDGIIWYTLDGSDPKTSETRTKYEGGQIAIDFDPDAGRTNITLKAYTERNDLWESSVATYVYEFTGEVEVPKGIVSVYDGKPQIGVEWRPFYTLVADEGSGATIDDEGNAVATNTGTYTVTAKIKDGYKWIIENDDLTTDEDESRTTTDDQTIEFSIEKAVNPLKVKGKKVKIKSKKLKKKNVRVKVSKCIRFVKKAQGTKSYKLISAKKGKKNFKKKFSVNAKTGKLTVKKKLKKGTYKVKVRVKAAGNKNYKPITKTVTFRVRIK